MEKLLQGAALCAGIMALSWSGALITDAQNLPKVKAFRMERAMSPQEVACIECHRDETPGLFVDWSQSRHANANVTCLDCHMAEEHDKNVSQSHYKQYEKSRVKYGTRQYRVPVSAVVTPKDCSRCHPDEAAQYSRSKHANTMEIIWKIDPWLNNGMNSDFERINGCYHCLPRHHSQQYGRGQ